MISFSKIVKQEIINKKFINKDKYAILLVLIKMLGVFNSNKEIFFQSSSYELIIFLKSLLVLYNSKMVINKRKIKKFKNEIIVYDLKVFTSFLNILKEHFIFENNNLVINNIDFLNTESSKRAFIAGAFIAKGSVNSPKISKYHLEIEGNDIDFMKFLKNLINNFNFNFKIIYRRNKPLIYIKSSVEVADFLKLIDASNAVLTFENERITRDMLNSINRLNNVDISNQQKVQLASQRQIMMINFLKKNNYFFPNNLKYRRIADLRLINPDASLNELCELYEKKYQDFISKSGINHIMREIKTTYLNKKKLLNKKKS